MCKVGIVSGSWDFCHPGHLQLFREVREHCDYLIVALQINPQTERPQKNKPIESVAERYLRLKACKYVDEIIPYELEDELIEMILVLRPDIRFLGEDWKGKYFKGNDIPMEFYFIPRHHNQSSTNLRERIKNDS